MLRLIEKPDVQHNRQVQPAGEPSDYASYSEWVRVSWSQPTDKQELVVRLHLCHDADGKHSAMIDRLLGALYDVINEAERMPEP
jgi:hypothetical protein